MKNDKTRPKIGILGGTFNPIHNGHLILAQNAAEEMGLDKVLIMPAGISYFKDQKLIASKEDRANMVKSVTKDNPLFEFSDIELVREGNSYTYETINELSKEDCDLYYIIGADTLFSIDTWKNPGIIFAKTTILCAGRDNVPTEKLTAKKQELEEKFNAKIHFLNAPEVEISSSQIRQLIKEGRTCRYYLPASVCDYICEHGLYK